MRKLMVFMALHLLILPVLGKSRKVANVTQDLAPYAGSYNLVKGLSTYCPDGEFGVGTDSFTVGADLRISDINKPMSTELLDKTSSCTLKRRVTFDGKTLQNVMIESCSAKSESEKQQILTFSKTATSHYVKLQFLKKTKNGDTYKSTVEFECLYTRDLP